MKLVDMEVQDIELVGMATDAIPLVSITVRGGVTRPIGTVPSKPPRTGGAVSSAGRTARPALTAQLPR